MSTPSSPSSPATTVVEAALDGAIGRITLARPQKLNALNRAALTELAAVAAWFDGRPDVKVVVIRGAGRAFSAGFDLDDPSWQDGGPPQRSAATGRAMAEAIAGMSAVTIAAIHGHCIGGGVVLAAACDLRVAAAGTRFRIPEIDLGIPLYWAGVPLLAREIGPARTKELVMTGRAFDADEAERIGFVNRVVADDELDATVDDLARELAAKPALALRVTKEQVEAVSPPVPPGDPGVESDIAGLGAAFADPESRAAAAAYLERTLRRR